MAVSISWGGLFVGVVIIRAILFEVCFRGPDFWKRSTINNCKIFCCPRCAILIIIATMMVTNIITIPEIHTH